MSACLRALAVAAFVVCVPALSLIRSSAQNPRDGKVKVTGISTRSGDNQTVVTLTADGAVNRTQTWQDDQGFHLVLPSAGQSDVKNLPKGVKVQRVGDSLEVIVPVKPGASVTVQPKFNRVNLVVTGSQTPNQQGVGSQRSASEKKPRAAEDKNARSSVSNGAEKAAPGDQKQGTGATSASDSKPAPRTQPASAPSQSQEPSKPARPVQQQTDLAFTNPNPAGQKAQGGQVNPQGPQQTFAQPSGTFTAILFSKTGALLALGLLVCALLVIVAVRGRRRRASQVQEVVVTTPADAWTQAESSEPKTSERRMVARRYGDPLPQAKTPGYQSTELVPKAKKQPVQKQSVSNQVMFGAYRVDQEVGKLLLGLPHRIDVLASRAIDDRRAIEAGLMKAINAQEPDPEAVRRARHALQDYGFVARQCAAVLMADDAYDRAAAARALGEIKAETSLPFLLEALYDNESVVKTQAVASLGELKMPSAIGALLDLARRHPEIPQGLISRSLNACTLDAFDIGESSANETLALTGDKSEEFFGEMNRAGAMARPAELPESLDDQAFLDALAQLNDPDAETRGASAAALAQYHAKRSVDALSLLATKDPETSVRAVAVTSLGAVDHESVLAPVLIAMADDSREVRAAAARALSRLSFDRADAFVRLAETASQSVLSDVASAAVKAGMAAQAIDRLAIEDRHHAYEAFALLSLLAKANETEPILDAIRNHGNADVRLAAVRLMGATVQPESAHRLRDLAATDGMPEKVKSALNEVVYKLDQLQVV